MISSFPPPSSFLPLPPFLESAGSCPADQMEGEEDDDEEAEEEDEDGSSSSSNRHWRALFNDVVLVLIGA